MTKLLIIADIEGHKQVALHRGIALAKVMGAQVEILAFCYESLQSLDEKVQQQARQAIIAQKQKMLNGVLQNIDCSGLQVKAMVVWEKALPKSILDHADKWKADMIIKTGNRTEHLLYTPTDWHLLRNANVPVMICAEKKWKRARPIVAAVDLTTSKAAKKKLNARVVSLAKQLAGILGVDLHIVCALDIPVILKDLDMIDVAKYRETKLAQIEPELYKLCRTFDLSREQFQIVTGQAHRVIPSRANKLKADLVVIGTMARAGVKGALQGNTSEKVLHHLRTDVLCVR